MFSSDLKCSDGSSSNHWFPYKRNFYFLPWCQIRQSVCWTCLSRAAAAVAACQPEAARAGGSSTAAYGCPPPGKIFRASLFWREDQAHQVLHRVSIAEPNRVTHGYSVLHAPPPASTLHAPASWAWGPEVWASGWTQGLWGPNWCWGVLWWAEDPFVGFLELQWARSSSETH